MTRELDPTNPGNMIYCPHSSCYARWEDRCSSPDRQYACIPAIDCQTGKDHEERLQAEFEKNKKQRIDSYQENWDLEEADVQAEFERRFAIAIKKYYDRTPEDNA